MSQSNYILSTADNKVSLCMIITESAPSASISGRYFSTVKPYHSQNKVFVANKYMYVLSKVFEKIVYSRLNEFLVELGILYDFQFGFRKKHSTHLALLILLDKLTEALDDGKKAIGIFLDFSKAFDTVNHDILLDKWFHYGIGGPAYKWFQS